MDKIEKQLVLKATRSRVWRAIADSSEFGAWFGMKLDGIFKAGATVRGRITTRGYEHLAVELRIDRVEPESHFSYRWHPYAVDTSYDYSSEPMTLVEMRLEERGPRETLLTLVESGFEHIPASRRAEAFRMNDGGWTAQMTNIDRHVSQGK